MQLAHVKISNVLSYPYSPDITKIEGIKFYNRKNNNVNILIGPNGAGKSGFLNIVHQIFKVGLMYDYVYDKQYIQKNDSVHFKKVISYNKQFVYGLHPHFASTNKPSQVVLHVSLTEHDYDNMKSISKHKDILHRLIQKYSDLSIDYSGVSYDEIHNIPISFELYCTFDHKKNIVVIDEKKLSPQGKFVLLCVQTLELVQICIDIYNEFERSGNDKPLIPLKNGIAFVSNNRSLKHIPHRIDPHTWSDLIGDKNSPYHHSYLGFYLCVKKIWNVMSNHWGLKMTKKDIANYSQKLKESDFFMSLVFIIKKYFDKTLTVEYANGLMEFYLIDRFGNYIPFSQLSDGEQSFLSIVFSIYGYDLKDGMIVIDEPEIHFHPQMQRSFAKMMEKINENIGTQFVVSTYSPLFVNDANIWSVYRFSNVNGETRIKNPVLSLSSDESSLVHLLKFENMSKMFFVNTIIMVEGETDAYFFEFYLNYLHTFPEWKGKIKDYEIININGKGSYKLWNKFLSKFGLNSYFLGDWDNVVDYGFMNQIDLNNYYKQARSYYAGLKKTKKTHRHYNKLVDTIRNLFPKKYRELIIRIDELYKKNVFILKKGDIETYLGMSDKGLDKTVTFCLHHFQQWLDDKRFDCCRKEFETIFSIIFK